MASLSPSTGSSNEAGSGGKFLLTEQGVIPISRIMRMHVNVNSLIIEIDGATTYTFNYASAGDAANAYSVAQLASSDASLTGALHELPPTGATLTVTVIAPNSGTRAGGTPVTITGTGFAPWTIITLGGGQLEQQVFVNSTQITGVTPGGGVAGAVDVNAWTKNQHASLPASYTYT